MEHLQWIFLRHDGRRRLAMTLLFLSHLLTVSYAQSADSVRSEKSWRFTEWLRKTIDGFTYIDTNYVEPQHYDWSVMAQATYNYDYYRLSSIGDNRQSVAFSPRGGLKVGPYFGWRWVFLGYTVDLSSTGADTRSGWKGFDLSVYSAQVGADLYYRHTRNNYRISDVNLGEGIDTRALEGLPFEGISVGITGFNIYYIFNHQRFSYPAAFAQSTCQKISCGSWMAGIGYLNNSIDFDHAKLEQIVRERCGWQQVELDSGLMFNSVRYVDLNASVGYAYNWVFARNWLLCASLSLALAYKTTRGESATGEEQGFSLDNFTTDGIGRFGIVYNNTRWYAGANAIIRAYNYSKSRFAANNIVGNINFYVGYNFGLRSQYKKKKL
ncbi:MAG: DUF4421 domain-containing protein [Prevotella sp.]|nr:DUF4421 domain-containing protein [Prevotella sp.]